MRITNLRIGGFKGVNAEEPVHPLTLLVGPNGSGKSARLQAIQWAATGQTDLGKKPESALPYGSPTGMSATIYLDDGFRFSRIVGLDHREGKVSQAVETSLPGNMGVREADAAIAEHIGRFMPMWDLGEFTSLSPDKRREVILALCGKASGASITNAHALIEVEILSELLGPGTVSEALAGVSVSSDEHSAARKALFRRLSSEQQDAMTAMYRALTWPKGADVSEYIAALTEKTKDLISQSKAGADSATAAARALSDRKAEIAVPSGTVEQRKEARLILLTQVEEVLKQIGVQQGKESARKSLTQELGRCREMLGRAKEKLGLITSVDVTDDAAKALALEQESEEIAKSVTAPEDNGAALESAMAQARADRENARLLLEQAKKTLFDSERDLKVSQATLSALESSDWVKVSDLTHRLFDYLADDGEGADIAAEIEEIARKNADPEGIQKVRAQVNDLRLTFAAAGEVVKGYGEQLELATETMQTAESAYQQGIQQFLAAKQAADAATEKARSLRAQAQTIRDDLTDRDAEIDDLNGAIEAHDKRHIELEGKLNALDAEGGQVSLESLDEQEKALRGQIKAADDEIDALIRFANLNAEYSRAVATAEKQRVQHEVAKAGLEAIKRVREQIMADLVRPLIGHIDEFLAATGRTERAYSRLENHRGTPIFDLGWTNGASETSMDTLSGGESVIFFAALAYAMTVLANPPLKVLLIEAAELDANRASELFSGLTTVGDRLGNIIVATCNASTGLMMAVDGTWNVVRTRMAVQ